MKLAYWEEKLDTPYVVIFTALSNCTDICQKRLSVQQYWETLLFFCADLFEMIVGVLTTCHTQYTWDRSICIFLFNRTTHQVFVTYLTGALYVHPLWIYKHQHDNRVRSKLFVACQRWWFQWPFWFVPSVPGYLWEEEEHKPDHWRNPIERNRMGLHLENEVAIRVAADKQTPTIISNNPVFFRRSVFMLYCELKYFQIRSMQVLLPFCLSFGLRCCND